MFSASKIKVGPHTKARTLEYHADVKRVPVTDKQVPWAAKFEGYESTEFENPELNPEQDVKEAKFNEKTDEIDRVSKCGPYKLHTESGLPLNPKGRTGLKGRGSLPRYGPNHTKVRVFTRIRTKEDGTPVRNNPKGKPVLECASVKVEGFDKIVLYNSPTLDDLSESVKTSLESAESKVVYEGYVDSELNTDNSWVETSVLFSNVSETAKVDFSAETALKWVTLDEACIDPALKLSLKPIVQGIRKTEKAAIVAIEVEKKKKELAEKKEKELAEKNNKKAEETEKKVNGEEKKTKEDKKEEKEAGGEKKEEKKTEKKDEKKEKKDKKKKKKKDGSGSEEEEEEENETQEESKPDESNEEAKEEIKEEEETEEKKEEVAEPAQETEDDAEDEKAAEEVEETPADNSSDKGDDGGNDDGGDEGGDDGGDEGGEDGGDD